MAQPKSRDRQIKIGGKPYKIVFGYRASLALQDHWGLETDEALFERLQKPQQKMRDFRDILWAALRTHHPEITVEDVTDMLDKEGVAGLAQSVQEAIAAAQPPADAKKKAPAKEAPSR